MTDPRPRPQYGEYATPEEQAKAMGSGAPAPTDVGDAVPDAAAPVIPVADVAHKLPAYGENAPAGSAPFVPPSAPTAAAPSASAPAAFTSSTAAPVVPPSNVGGSAASTASATPTTRPRRRWDVVLTAVLLGMGVVSVVSSIPQYADFGATMQSGISQLGYGEYTAVALANTIGIAINVTQIVLYLITAFIAIRVVQRGRIGFYIPLIGAFVSGVVTVVLLIVAITGDPALLSQISGGV
jgi:hypothetical protein